MCGLCNQIRKISISGNNIADGVSYGVGWKRDITYAFTNSEDQYEYSHEASNNFAPVTEYQSSSALFALEKSFGTAANDGFSVEGFTRVKISEGMETDATLRFAQSDTPATAYAYLPGAYEQAGDMWFGRNYDYTNATAGNYAWHSILHEIGHGLGLKHGHESQNGFKALPREFDSLEFSVMTYRSYVGSNITSYSYSEWSAPQTYMMADIAALQKLYGADFSTNSGNTVYSWTPDSGQTWVNGEVGVDAGGNVIFATIWDGGGRDTYDLSAYATDLDINLTAGKASAFGTSQLADLGDGHTASGNIYSAMLYNGNRRSLIEDAIGGTGNDTIVGNAAKNRLAGGDGDDVIQGGNGKDILSGGRGTDVLTGGRMADTFVFRLLGGTDIVTDFVDGTDKLRIDVADADYAALITNSVQVGGDLVILLGEGSSITIESFDKSDLKWNDFVH